MKISAKDEYGLRILIRIARDGGRKGLNIPQLAESENMSTAYVGKITRLLRMAGLIRSSRGQKGGYLLSRKPGEITVSQVVEALGGQLFDDDFCRDHAGSSMMLCTNSVDCSVRSLWKVVQRTVDHLLQQVTIAHLIQSEEQAINELDEFFQDHVLQANILTGSDLPSDRQG